MEKERGVISRGLRGLFGDIHWSAPPWLKNLKAAKRNRPRRFWGVVFGLLLIPLCALTAWQLWQMLPQPVLTQVEIEAPGITRVGEDGKLYPEPATLRFYTEYTDARQRGPRSAARLDLLGKELEQGVLLKQGVLEPSLSGTWRWLDDNTLRFEPEEDWPAGQTYEVSLSPELFANGVRLAEARPAFTTPAISGELKKLEFYQNPEKTSEHRVVATLRFTHAVNPASLKDHLRLTMRAVGKSIDAEAENYPYQLRLGEQGREAYITSEPLQLPEQENFMALILAPGVTSALGTSATAAGLEQKVRIPALSTFFRITSLSAQIVRNENNDPEQTLVMEFTDGVETETVARNIQAWELPADRHWTQDKIDSAVLQRSRKLSLHGNPSEREFAKLQSFRFEAEEQRQILVRLPAGLISEGGFKMTVPYVTLLRTPSYPREARIMGEGALLAMTGERQLSLQARGIPALRVEIFRLLDGQVAHLVTQTRGDLAAANFNYNFNEENFGQRFERILPLNGDSPAEATYASLDLAPYLQDAGRGLFVVRVQGWDPVKKRRIYGAEDRRLILVTDLSIIAKNNADQTHELFVHSLGAQAPVAGATIELLGRNGQPVITVTTDADGHAHMPDVSSFRDARQATVYLVRRQGDIAFLPFERHGRSLDYSRFDTGGLRMAGQLDQRHLRATLFSDRGIYRPGEKGHLGIMVKHDDWQPVAGVPVEVTLTNPRGNVVLRERVALPADGFIEQALAFATTDPTGTYRAQVYLLDDRDRQRRLRQLGETTLAVEEFQPDTMRIRTVIEGGEAPGWRTLLEYQGEAALENLFGLPAQDRRVQASYSLTPVPFRFSAWSDYVFEDPFASDKDRLTRSVTESLPEARSNTEGEAAFAIDLSAYGRGLYRLTFAAEGYESGGGRSVSARSSILVSPAQRLVGWKVDGALNYLRQDSERNLQFVAIDPALQSVAMDQVTLLISEQRRLSTLVRQSDGTLSYQTIVKRVPVSEEAFTIAKGGSSWRLPTGTPGDFVVEARVGDLLMARIEYSVIGARNLDGGVEKNAELDVKLNRSDYRPGEEIELQITAPYAGAGLITIERDRVYAYQWFSADSGRSLQRIRIPEELEGNGYVNVTFVRALDSEEIFTQPLSYAVAPFNVDRGARTIDIELEAPDKVKPGSELTLKFQTSRPGRIVVFAVDEGILQVADYQTPRPLDTFLRKRALEVGTAQMADLLMPEFRLLRQAAGIGGGDSAANKALGANLNPFQRNVKAPVVYWSGIVEASGEPQSLSFTVPDYFDGQLRLMAVASGSGAAGSVTEKVLVRGPFVLQPNLITTAAPGDVFDVSVGVTNALPAETGERRIEVLLQPSEHLAVVGKDSRQLTLAPGREGRAAFQVKAVDKPGAAELVFSAHSEEYSLSRTATLSVRPAVPYRTTVDVGIAAAGEGDLALERRLMPELAEQKAAVGYSPLILADGLQAWLRDYPHGCTEQIVSGVFPALALLRDPAVALDRDATLGQYRSVIGSLQARQAPNGGFGFWPGSTQVDSFVSLYAMHFLIDAADLNIPVPEQLLTTGLEYLRTRAAQQPVPGQGAYEQAYAIYLLTRSGRVTTHYLTLLQEALEKQPSQDWRGRLVAAYMAAAYRQLKLDDLAWELISGYTFAEAGSDYERDMDSALARNAQYVYLLARHFPERLGDLDDAAIQRLIAPISEGDFNTLSSAYTLLALGAWGQEAADAAGTSPLAIAMTGGAQAAPEELATGEPPAVRSPIPLDAQALIFNGGDNQRLFYSATQSGYDTSLPTEPVRQGMEIIREYVNDAGEVVTSAPQGAELTVRLRLRSLDNRHHENIAVVDLLPGGFEVKRESVRGGGNSWSTDYIDIREDRLVLYGSLDSTVRSFSYKVKVTGAGSFVIPPAFAQSMYQPDLQAQSLPGHFEVGQP